MAFFDAGNQEAQFWNDLLNIIGQQLNVNQIQRLAVLCGIPERPLEQIISDSIPGSALFKELDKNADLWFGESEKLKEWMLYVERNDLVDRIDEYVAERGAREFAAAASCEKSATRREAGDAAAELGLNASLTYRNDRTNGVPAPSSSRFDEVSIAIDFLCENFADQAEWKPICRKLGFKSKDFDSLKSSSSSSVNGFLHFLNNWRQTRESDGNSKNQLTAELIIALGRCEKNSSADKLTKKLQMFREGGSSSRRA